MPDGASMFPTNDLFTNFARSYDARRETEMSLSEYLEGCRDDPMMYAGAGVARAWPAIGAGGRASTSCRSTERVAPIHGRARGLPPNGPGSGDLRPRRGGHRQ